MKNVRDALVCMLLAATIVLVAWAVRIERDADDLVRAMPGELRATRADVTRQVEEARRDVLAASERQIAATRTDVLGEVARIRVTADRRTGDTLSRVDVALGQIDELRTDLKPTLNYAASIAAHANDASAILFRSDALPAQLLGVTAAAKVTLGQTAETMRDIQRATPQMLATWERIGANVKATTEASTDASRNTAQVMANFARATKPLPTWVRIGLAIAPPVAQMGASVATTVALTGQVGK